MTTCFLPNSNYPLSAAHAARAAKRVYTVAVYDSANGSLNIKATCQNYRATELRPRGPCAATSEITGRSFAPLRPDLQTTPWNRGSNSCNQFDQIKYGWQFQHVKNTLGKSEREKMCQAHVKLVGTIKCLLPFVSKDFSLWQFKIRIRISTGKVVGYGHRIDTILTIPISDDGDRIRAEQ